METIETQTNNNDIFNLSELYKRLVDTLNNSDFDRVKNLVPIKLISEISELYLTTETEAKKREAEYEFLISKKERLEQLRAEIQAERISTGELLELQSLIPYIDKGDVELLEWAGVPEFEEEPTETYYIEYLNKAKGFKKDRKDFDSYEEAKTWAIDNLGNYNPDMIRIQHTN